jgi:hypothetical protein
LIDKGIHAGPVKGQCSRSYFYGKDLRLEKLIQRSEGMYSSTVKRIAEKLSLSDWNKFVLRHFCLLQYCRTEAASQRMALAYAEIADVAFDGSPPADVNVPVSGFVQDGMQASAESFRIIDDLKVCLIRNGTQRQFVTSDDPAILTNRWYLQNPRAKGLSFGLQHSGALLFLPVTPDIICVIYDGDVYSIPNDGGWTATYKITDVEAFNEHQSLGCVSNLFFAKWVDLDEVHRAFLQVLPQRPSARHELVVAVLEAENSWGNKYRVVTGESISGQEEVLFHLKGVNPRPSRWPSIIKWREKPRVYSNGTGTGYVRRSQALREGGYRRVP